MAENGLPNDALHESAGESAVKDRRDFFKRAAQIGVPVVLATVRAPNAWAQDNKNGSCTASVSTSGCK
jgi:hypothetical protein